MDGQSVNCLPAALLACCMPEVESGTVSGSILHVDMDAFFAAVEQRDRPELRGRPVVVGAGPAERGVVSTASYEARAFGVHSAMPSREAAKRCPDAVFVPVDSRKYRAVSARIFEIFERFTPTVEKLSIDEAFLDVTGAHRLFGSSEDIARAVKQAVRDETGLTASVGVAPNKFLAKLASDLDKPDGITVVPTTPPEITAFLAPLPVRRLWGVGAVTQGRLAVAGVGTIGDLQACSFRELARCVGSHLAGHLQRLARGEDLREVLAEPTAEKSISREHTFPVDCSSAQKVKQVLSDLVEDVGRRLREDGRQARTAHLKLRWKGFKTVTRQCRIDLPGSDDLTLRRVAERLLDELTLAHPVRLVGFGVSDLRENASGQLSLFEATPDDMNRRDSLSRSVDRIRDTYGRDSIRRASRVDSLADGDNPPG